MLAKNFQNSEDTFMPKNLEAAVFDIDGMLLDTREFIFQAFEHSLAVHGHPVPERVAIAEYVGMSRQVTYQALAPDGNIEMLCSTHDLFQSDKLDLIISYRGLRDMLNSLKGGGLKLGAFSSRYNNLIPSLDHAGILDYFDAIVQGDEVSKHKPDPEGLHKVLDSLGVSADKASMSGDAVVDILAGKAAGVAMTVAITHGFGRREALLKAGPTFIVDNLVEIPPLLLGNS